MEINTLHRVETFHPADSVEWNPYEGYHEMFALGTYHLEENQSPSDTSAPCTRTGRIDLFKYDTDANILRLVTVHDTPAILDQKWIRVNASPHLATANANGFIEIYSVTPEETLQLLDKAKLISEFDNILALSLDAAGDRILASDSKGGVTMMRGRESKYVVEEMWKAHTFEAWTCCFDRNDPEVVYTGGDDTCLHVYDMRTEKEPQLKTVNKSHLAGVTSLLSYPDHSHKLVTGSYDEIMRIFDTRNLKKNLTEINLGGGIWRLKPHPVEKDLILVACMYHNFTITKLASDDSLSCVGAYGEHESICYGADWCYKLNTDYKIMATCSFYDKKLCISIVR